jgi:hypothetical protein
MSKNIPAQSLKTSLAYYYILAYTPSESIDAHKAIAGSLQETAAKQAGLAFDEYVQAAAPQISHRIVAFHQDRRDPAEDWVAELIGRILVADQGIEQADAFQKFLGLISRLPQRAKPKNRLHRKRGCQFCAAPCHYGYFSLLYEPPFELLQGFLETELENPIEDKKPVMAVKSFALTYLIGILGTTTGTLHIHQEHLANLAYCLLSLATAKSRLPVPEKQLKLFQQANQYFSRVNIPTNEA